MQNKVETQTEGGFLLKLFQLEKFVKKNKHKLIVIGGLMIVSFLGIQINNYLETQKLIKTNEAYNLLLEKPDNKEALQVLKTNKKLYRLYLLQVSNNSIDKLKEVAKGTGIVANIAKYQLALIKGDKSMIENYALGIGAIYKDLALLNLERLYLQENNIEKAKKVIENIEDEQISKLANSFLHYGVVK